MGKSASKIIAFNDDDLWDGVPLGKNAAIRSSCNPKLKKGVENVARLMLPVYYIENHNCTAEELLLAKEKWAMVLHNTSAYFLAVQGEPGYEQATCMCLFYDKFFSRFFDIHPLAKSMFTAGLKSQGKFLIQMMTFTLTLADKHDKFEEAMINLAEVHNHRGVKALEYGIVGEVLFWTLRHCLGPEYDQHTHRVWVKLFSRMLSIIVPNAIRFEMESGDAQVKRIHSMQKDSQKSSLEDNISSVVDTNNRSHSVSQFIDGMHFLYGMPLNSPPKPPDEDPNLFRGLDHGETHNSRGETKVEMAIANSILL